MAVGTRSATLEAQPDIIAATANKTADRASGRAKPDHTWGLERMRWADVLLQAETDAISINYPLFRRQHVKIRRKQGSRPQARGRRHRLALP